MRMDVHGINGLVIGLQKMGILIYINGVVKMDVNGFILPVTILKVVNIMMYCIGVSKMDAHAKYVVNIGISKICNNQL
jgi:hypothetical protein